MSTPSQELAQLIASRLVKEGLLHEEDAKALTPKISSGTARNSDWRLALEKRALPRGERP